ncbi:MAG: fibronectin type III domain-containing protein [Thermoplasmatota archaeon]
MSEFMRLFTLFMAIFILSTGSTEIDQSEIDIVYGIQSIMDVNTIRYVGVNSTYSSIQDAMNNSNDGDTIIIDPGIYYESVVIDKSNIVIKGNSSDQVKIITTNPGSLYPPSDGGFCFWIEDTENISISGINLSLEENNNTGIGIFKGNNISLSNIKIDCNGNKSSGLMNIFGTNISINNVSYNTENTFGNRGIIFFSSKSINSNISNYTFVIDNCENCFGICLRGNGYLKFIKGLASGKNSGGITLRDSSNIKLTDYSVFLNSSQGDMIGLTISSQTDTIINNVDIFEIGRYSIGIELIGSNDIVFTNCSIKPGSSGKYVIKTSNSVFSLIDSLLTNISDFDYDIYSIESEIDYYYSGIPNTFIDSSSVIKIYGKQYITFLDEYNDTISGLDLKFFSSGEVYYSTSFFGGADRKSDESGNVQNVTVLMYEFRGSNNIKGIANQITVHYDKTNLLDTFTLSSKTSSHTLILNIYPPKIPVEVSANAIPDTQDVNISWICDDISPISFNVYSNQSDEWKIIGKTTNHFYLDLELPENEYVYYGVSSFDGKYESNLSEIVNVKVNDVTNPLPPTDFKADNIGPFNITLKWNRSISIDIEEYIIQINSSLNPEIMVELLRVDRNISQVVIDDLIPNTTYSFNIYAIDHAGNPSILSEKIEIVTLKINSSLKLIIHDANNMSINNEYNIIITNLVRNITLFDIYTIDRTLMFNDFPLNIPFRIEIFPQQADLGIINTSSGYLNYSLNVEAIGDEYINKIKIIEINLTYYDYTKEITGVISGRISYKDKINDIYFLEGANITIENKRTDEKWLGITNEGGYFSLYGLPLNGTYNMTITPPSDMIGIINESSGILPSELNDIVFDDNIFINLEIELEYYIFVPTEFSLSIIDYGPTSDIHEETLFWIYFNNSISIQSFIESVSISPSGIIYDIKKNNQSNNFTFRIKDLESNKNHILILNGSLKDTSGNEYEFETFEWMFFVEDEQIGNKGGIGFNFILLLTIGVIIIIIILILILNIRRRNKIKLQNSIDDRLDKKIFDESNSIGNVTDNTASIPLEKKDMEQ